MNSRPLSIPVILGTTRKGRMSAHAAHFMVGQIGKRDNVQTELIDISKLPMPIDNAGEDIKDPAFAEKMAMADALVIVTPEYNHGYPGSLKSVLDLLLKEYIHKAVAFVGVSAGPWGGTRVIEACVPMVRELGLAVTFTDLNFPSVKSKFDSEGNLLDEAYETRVQGFLDELIWMARTLKWGRENVPSKFHQ